MILFFYCNVISYFMFCVLLISSTIYVSYRYQIISAISYIPCGTYNLPFIIHNLIFTMWNSKFTTHPLTFSLRHLLIHSPLSFLRNRVLSFEFYGFCSFERTFCDNSQSTYCTSQARTTCKSNWLFIFLYIFCDH